MSCHAASSELFCDLASSGQCSCQSCGRNSFLLIAPQEFSSILLDITGPKNNLPFEYNILFIYPMVVPHEEANCSLAKSLLVSR